MTVVVVGAGAAGSALSWILAKSGRRVVCLERGQWADKSEVGPAYPSWERARQSLRNHLPSVRQRPEDYPIDDSESPIKVANFNAVGGSTILYSAHFPRFLPIDFHVLQSEGIGRDWPISYEDLRPFYDINEERMHLSGLPDPRFYPEMTGLRKPVKLGRVGARLINAFNQLGWHAHRSFAAINTESSNVLGVCNNLGPCNVGCPTNAKATADQIYMKPAVELGVELKESAAVSRVLMSGRRAIGVEYFNSAGEKKVQDADEVFVAASAVGTARVLLNSASSVFPKGLGNSTDQVGGNLMMHPMAYVEGLFDEDMDTDVGPQGALLFSLEFHRLVQSELKLGYMLHVLRGDNPILSSVSSYRMGRLSFGEGLARDFYTGYRRRLGIAVVVEDAAEPMNRVSLDWSKADSFGVPGAKVRYRVSENSRALLKHGIKSASRVLRKAGAHSIWSHAPLSDTGWHANGTAAMAVDENDGATDPNGRVYGTENVFVADSSLFPSCSTVNPANTVQALALYIGSLAVGNA